MKTYYRVRENKILTYFDGVPMYCIRDDMKRHGWRWDPDEMCWWHWFTDEALQYAKTHWKPADNNTYNHTKMNKKPTTSNSLFLRIPNSRIRYILLGNDLFIIGFFDAKIPGYTYETYKLSPWYLTKEQIKVVNICDGISSIGKRAFYRLNNLESVDIGDSVHTIGERAFADCENLKSVKLPLELKTIESLAFRNCTSIQELVLPNKDVEIASDAFQGWNKNQKILYIDKFTGEQKSIYPTQYEQQTKEIAFGDFVVLSNKNYCLSKKHQLEDIKAQLCLLRRDGSTSVITIPAGYCRECDQYFIQTYQYQQLIAQGIPMCRIIKESFQHADGVGFYENLNEESILRQFGYTVNKHDDLSSKQRHTILACLIESKIYNCDRFKILGHLSWLIKRSEGKYDMADAVCKWKEDRNFVENYKIGDCSIVQIKSLKIRK